MASELIKRDMYGKKYHLVHNPNARGSQPRYVLNQTGKQTKPKGVTTIMGATIAKDLTKWAVDCCVEELTDKLPVITKDDLDSAAKAYTRKRDSGASTGTETHALVERYLKGTLGENGTGGASQEARNAYNAFVRWFVQSGAEVINVEEVIYSEAYDFAGTYDAMMRIDGKVMLTDLKTTNASRKAPNGVYAENFVQLGAYALAHEEQRMWEFSHPMPDGTFNHLSQVEGLAVISAKKNGKLDFVTNEDLGLSLEDCMGMARRVVDLYHFMEYSTKQLGGK